jgi:hypothetical protein
LRTTSISATDTAASASVQMRCAVGWAAATNVSW